MSGKKWGGVRVLGMEDISKESGGERNKKDEKKGFTVLELLDRCITFKVFSCSVSSSIYHHAPIYTFDPIFNNGEGNVGLGGNWFCSNRDNE